ncbi:FAD-binding and (Fe-S)-binding domain-containing protein [Changpingibacter yushuensis]|uniref:FAD-binding and (Fe-S)-binding domain-containing protein n=1 Tax=Changpingibacter yushuensis TaxID=2758440 RepID=UPI00165E212A|nr:FAD-binding and (Fe-S)-binding domain-containing protein [Changpingibacter yushuensis]
METREDDLLALLREKVRGDVDSSARRRAEYSTDASNYRIPPRVVVAPLDAADVEAVLEVARATKVPVTSRGAGTSCAGNAVGPGIVLDFSRYMNTIIEVDPQARTARVQPGVIMADLQKVAGQFGLRFGPDPSTQNRATFGGMIGNNACGPHAVAYGRTSDNVEELTAFLADGTQIVAHQGSSQVAGLAEIVDENLAAIRTEMGRFKRQVSGYSLEHLLPENGVDLAKFLVGSEGTLAVVTEAVLTLVPIAASPALVVLGYPDMPAAADDVPALLTFDPLAVEGIDAQLVDVVRRAKGSVPDLPPGGGWLFIEVGAREGELPEEVMARAEALAHAASTTAFRICEAGPEATELWRIRADGAGLGGRTPDGRAAWPGWEDSAVPPEELGSYLRALRELMDKLGLDGLMYGHFGDGCVHVRIDFPIEDESGTGTFRSFMEQGADLVAQYGGSLSGEHGDGRARSELLGRMYSEKIIDVFGKVKAVFDPANLLNPGVLVNPDVVDAHLRRPAAKVITYGGGFHFEEDGGDFSRAVHRCTGVGNCRADRFDSGFFMCPSYSATKDEKDVTRGRARVLQEVANGQLVHGWDAPELLESLDLCLSCKACSRDCPTGIDVARYRSEVLYRAYKGKLRPRTHYTLGNLPLLAGLVTVAPAIASIANAVMSLAPIRKLAFRLAGIDPRRDMPSFSTKRFSRSDRVREMRADDVADPTVHGLSKDLLGKRYVVLWADSFSETLDSRGALAEVEVLQRAGYTVLLPESGLCCGLTSISTGQLTQAKKNLTALLEALAPYAASGIPIVGVEPSCTAVLRSDVLDLLPDDPRSQLVSRMTFTLAELLTAPAPIGPSEDFELPDLSGVEIVAQPHCHHYSVMGWNADEQLLRRAGATVTKISGCCGLAGNFGMEQGHFDISEKIAKQHLVPALEHASPDAVFLADGFSCRTQAEQFAGARGVHLAQLLRDGTQTPRQAGK